MDVQQLLRIIFIVDLLLDNLPVSNGDRRFCGPGLADALKLLCSGKYGRRTGEFVVFSIVHFSWRTTALIVVN